MGKSKLTATQRATNEIARLTPVAVRKLRAILTDPDSPITTQVQVASYIIDQGIGKPVARAVIGGDPQNPVSFLALVATAKDANYGRIPAVPQLSSPMDTVPVQVEVAVPEKVAPAVPVPRRDTGYNDDYTQSKSEANPFVSDAPVASHPQPVQPRIRGIPEEWLRPAPGFTGKESDPALVGGCHDGSGTAMVDTLLPQMESKSA
jgi:hypothetical protein